MNKVRKNRLAIFLFMFPPAVIFIGIIIIPIFMSGYYSLLDWDGITQGTFINIKNYLELFTSKSIGFPKALRNVILYTAFSVFIQLPFSFLLAVIVSNLKKHSLFFLTIFFVPVLMSTVVIGQLWMKIYHADYGLLNTLLRAIGLDNWCNAWLGDQKTALVAVFIPMLWQYVGYHMLLMYAGIKSMNQEMMEAARIDGASKSQITFKILVPLLKPVIQMCVIFSVMGSLKSFDLVYVLTNGGPAHASEMPSTLMVSMIFGRNRYGLGSSIALLIIFLCFFFAIVIKKAFGIQETVEE